MLFFCWYQVLLCDFPTEIVKSMDISLKPEFPTLKIGFIRVPVGENALFRTKRLVVIYANEIFKTLRETIFKGLTIRG